MEEPTLTIGQVAARAGVNSSTIRYYERVGVLPQPERRGGQRRYTDEAIRRLGVINIAKRAGFTLDDARALLATGEHGAPPTNRYATSHNASSPRSTRLSDAQRR